MLIAVDPAFSWKWAGRVNLLCVCVCVRHWDWFQGGWGIGHMQRSPLTVSRTWTDKAGTSREFETGPDSVIPLIHKYTLSRVKLKHFSPKPIFFFSFFLGVPLSSSSALFLFYLLSFQFSSGVSVNDNKITPAAKMCQAEDVKKCAEEWKQDSHNVSALALLFKPRFAAWQSVHMAGIFSCVCECGANSERDSSILTPTHTPESLLFHLFLIVLWPVSHVMTCWIGQNSEEQPHTEYGYSPDTEYLSVLLTTWTACLFQPFGAQLSLWV